MMGLDDISLGTWAAIGCAWIALSTALALGLGRILGRTNAAAMRERAELSAAEDAARPESIYYDGWFSDLHASDDDLQRGGSRASSGTRFKAVKLQDEVQERKVRRVL